MILAAAVVVVLTADETVIPAAALDVPTVLVVPLLLWSWSLLLWLRP